jgi:hypothetical protein
LSGADASFERTSFPAHLFIARDANRPRIIPTVSGADPGARGASVPPDISGGASVLSRKFLYIYARVAPMGALRHANVIAV